MTRLGRYTARRLLVPVRDIAEIDLLIKESEILTAAAGRTFIVFAIQVRSYRIELRPEGHMLTSIESAEVQYLHRQAWLTHPVGRALKAGLVYTPAAIGRAVEA